MHGNPQQFLFFQDAATNLMTKLEKQHLREKQDLVSAIEAEKRIKEQQIFHEYMSHYMLGLKVWTLQHEGSLYQSA